MKTLRIVSTDPASQGPFITINVTDFVIGQHEPFAEEDQAALREVENISADIAPGGLLTIEQARSQFEAETASLQAGFADERARLDARAEELSIQAEKLNSIQAELKAERERLDALAASLATKNDDGSAHMTVPQIKEALTAKGIEIPSGANKAELLALLNPAE